MGSPTQHCACPQFPHKSHQTSAQSQHGRYGAVRPVTSPPLSRTSRRSERACAQAAEPLRAGVSVCERKRETARVAAPSGHRADTVRCVSFGWRGSWGGLGRVSLRSQERRRFVPRIGMRQLQVGTLASRWRCPLWLHRLLLSSECGCSAWL